MSNPLRAPRGTTSSIEARVLLDGELAYDTTIDLLRVGDGTTLGGKIMNPGLDGVYTLPNTLFDGSTDVTTTIQAALDAGYSKIILPAGTCVVSTLSIPSNTVLEGQGPGQTIIQRKASSAAGQVLFLNSTHDIVLRGFTVDGNKANQTLQAYGINAYAYYRLLIEDVEFKNCKSTDAGLATTREGDGVYLNQSADLANNSRSRLVRVYAHDNQTAGINCYKSSNLSFEGCVSLDNEVIGLNLSGATDSPVTPVNQNIVIDGGDYGRSPYGLRAPGGSYEGVSGTYYTHDRYHTRNLSITGGARFHDCSTYGILAQANTLSIDSSVIIDVCGTATNADTTNGGVNIAGSRNVVFEANVVRNIGYISLDAGGVMNGRIGGLIADNVGARNTIIAVSLGTAIDTDFTATVHGNYGATGGTEVLASAIDGGSTGFYSPWVSGRLRIKGASISIGAAARSGLVVTHQWLGFEADDVTIDNTVGSADPVRVEVATRTGLGTAALFRQRSNRVRLSTGSYTQTATAATTTVIPDVGDVIYISGATTISTIYTTSQSNYLEKVWFVLMTNAGSSYETAPTVGFSGGGGSGAAGNAALLGDGTIGGVYMTNNGTGYSSAPTVSFTGGGGASAAGTALTTCNNAHERIVTLYLDPGCVIDHSTANLYLAGAADYTAGANGGAITLRGMFGSWYEVARGS